jgi:hypothetical protein
VRRTFSLTARLIPSRVRRNLDSYDVIEPQKKVGLLTPVTKFLALKSKHRKLDRHCSQSSQLVSVELFLGELPLSDPIPVAGSVETFSLGAALVVLRNLLP